MEHFCYEHGRKVNVGWTQNYGYIVETDPYRYLLRYNPPPGDHNAYLSCFNPDVQLQNIAQGIYKLQSAPDMTLGGM